MLMSCNVKITLMTERLSIGRKIVLRYMLLFMPIMWLSVYSLSILLVLCPLCSCSIVLFSN